MKYFTKEQVGYSYCVTMFSLAKKKNQSLKKPETWSPLVSWYCILGHLLLLPMSFISPKILYIKMAGLCPQVCPLTSFFTWRHHTYQPPFKWAYHPEEFWFKLCGAISTFHNPIRHKRSCHRICVPPAYFRGRDKVLIVLGAIPKILLSSILTCFLVLSSSWLENL